MRIILKILIKYSCRQSQFSIIESFDLEALTIKKVISKLVEVMPEPDFSNNKLGGPESIVQIDKTMLNYKCKGHQGRSPHNRTDPYALLNIKKE
ncbi:hypothetical protein H311_03647 [Anncaliia algerae PRA109]|nr:hypothetical protein H311_03647 [Anncaliia algerae PRA109]